MVKLMTEGCYITGAILVKLTWPLHTRLYKFVLTISTNIARMEKPRDFNLGEVVLNIMFKIFDFIF